MYERKIHGIWMGFNGIWNTGNQTWLDNPPQWPCRNLVHIQYPAASLFCPRYTTIFLSSKWNSIELWDDMGILFWNGEATTCRSWISGTTGVFHIYVSYPQVTLDLRPGQPMLNGSPMNNWQALKCVSYPKLLLFLLVLSCLKIKNRAKTPRRAQHFAPQASVNTWRASVATLFWFCWMPQLRASSKLRAQLSHQNGWNGWYWV